MYLQPLFRSSFRQVVVRARSASRPLTSAPVIAGEVGIRRRQRYTRGVSKGGTLLVFGGAGLVGYEVCSQALTTLEPARVVMCGLTKQESEAAVTRLKTAVPDSKTVIEGDYGNLFVPTEFSNMTRAELMESPEIRSKLMAALYDDFEIAYNENHMVTLFRRHQPTMVVDCLNTATGLSYQDVFDGAAVLRNWMKKGLSEEAQADLEKFLLSQTSPQLIRHVRYLQAVTEEMDSVEQYVKVGTTGTGGLGLNIPYTHSEDKPSNTLMAKNEAAFGHTGLLFLLDRTPGAPSIKEIKPAAMLGFDKIETAAVMDKHGNSKVFQSEEVDLGSSMNLREEDASYKELSELKMATVATGENGLFTAGEFSAITALGQMEFLPADTVARTVIGELHGNTGRNTISAMDSACMDPSYKGGVLRKSALEAAARVEAASNEYPSVALGRLGPPELSKLLFEAQLFKHVYGALADVLSDAPEKASKKLEEALEASNIKELAPSIGIPIMLSSGKLLRGPRINIPEVVGGQATISITPEDVDKYAAKGWVDLRPGNMEKWQKRVKTMNVRRVEKDIVHGSGMVDSMDYHADADSLDIGEVVAWVFNNEMTGYRTKP